jgi:hypothetical protein
MKAGYVVNYEVWRGGAAVKWGNFALDVEDEEITAGSVLGAIQEDVSSLHQCAVSAVRVVGLFKV